MWYTFLIILGIFLAWFITNGILSLTMTFLIIFCKFPPYTFQIPILVMQYLKIPSGFITLISYLTNFLLVGLYYMYRLPESPEFKFWSGWNYMREKHFSIKTTGVQVYENQQVIYAVAPHGCYGESVMFYFTLHALYKNVVTISTSLLFWIPIVREFACLGGAVPANTADIAHQLDSGKSIVMLPEGIRGVIHLDDPLAVIKGIPGECDPREGFIKCAVTSKKHKDIQIVPVFAKNANKLYYVVSHPALMWLQKKFLKQWYYPWPVINFGWYGTFWPKAVPITIHFGKPISLIKKNGGGDIREVSDIHKEYCDEILRLSLL